MAIELNPITNPEKVGGFNTNFQLIEDELNDNVLRRKGIRPGEANHLEIDLDLNGHDVVNAGTVGAQDITVGGVSIKTQADSAASSAQAASTSASEASNSASKALASENAAEAARDQVIELIPSSGYQFVGDYAAGIEITYYNQLVRDENGEFWRASGSTELPYTTDGSGLPEGGAFVAVGDAVLREDLVQPVATFNNVADMKNAGGLSVGRKARTLGYYSPGDGGGNDYEIVAAGTGTDDGGSFIDLSGSGLQAEGLFLNAVSILQFGVINDGSTNAQPGVQAAVDYVSNSDHTRTVFAPYGKYLLSSPVRIKKSINFIGEGMGSTDLAASQPQDPRTDFIMDFAGTAFILKSEVANEYIHMPVMKDFYVTGSNVGLRAVQARSTRAGYFRFGAERLTFAAMVIDTGNGSLAANNYIDYLFYQAGSNAAAESSHGLLLQDVDASGIGTTRTCANFIQCTTINGAALFIRDHDAGYFARVDGDVLFDSAGGTQPRPSRKNHIGFLNGNITANAGSRNSVGMINSEPSSVTLNGDAVVDYTVIDRNNGSRFETFRYQMSGDVDVPFLSYGVVNGSPTTQVLGGAQTAALLFPEAADTKISIPLTIPRNWSEGVITTVTALLYSPTSGDVVTKAGVLTRAPGSGLGSGVVESVNVITPVGGVIVEVVYTIGKILPLEHKLLSVYFERVGTLEDDNLASGLGLLGLSVRYEGGGPFTDGGKSWDVPVDVQ